MPPFRFSARAARLPRAALVVAALVAQAALLALIAATPAQAADGAAPPEYTVTLVNHQFQPPTLAVSAATRFVLVVRNDDASGDEVESHDLKVEKRIGGHQTIRLPLGPLAPGRYEFVAEQHEDTAKGALVVK